MKSTDKFLDLAKKLYELSKRGIDGERENAAEKLKQLMERTGISLSDLEENHIQEYVIKVKKEVPKSVIYQVVYKVTDRDWYGALYKGKLYADLTTAEYLELSFLLPFYETKYLEDLGLFTDAFIQANDLFRPSGSIVEVDSMTPERLERTLKLLNLTKGMEKHTYNKQLKQC